ncbi:MAG: type II toxin-antitoxin system VapC family toxin [Treponema sp.]|nr:type II toxin-antitoxin system VapC family toxin [Treponema sp.]
MLLEEDGCNEVRNAMKGKRLVSPACLPYEIGISLTAAVKNHRIDARIVSEIYKEFEKLPVRLIDPDIKKAGQIAAEEKQYTYDAYYIVCALDMELPLYSLNNGLITIATKRGVKCL